MARRSALAALLAAFFAASLAGCGGGGGSAVTPLPPPAPAFVTPDAQFRVSAATPFAAGCDGAAATDTLFVNAEVEPHVAVNPRNPDNVVAAWQQDRWSGGAARGVLVGVSPDGARTWTRVALPFSRCAGGVDERATDPWLSFAPDGSAYAMALAVSGQAFAPNSSSAMLVARSTDGGRNWSAPVALIRDGANAFNDKNSLTADPTDARYAYAVWDRLLLGGGGPLMFARTSDGGASWEPARAIFDPGPNAQTIGAVVAVLPNGTLVTLFTRIDSVNGQNASTLWVLRSTDKGASWSAPIKIADLLAVGAFVPETRLAIRDGSTLAQIAVGTAGELYAVWQDARFASGSIDAVALSKSTDGGLSWSAPARVSAVANAQAFTPQVHVARDGTVGVSYFDLRNDTPDAGSTATDYWLARSRDGGASWTETRIAGPFDIQRAPNARGLFLGDYQGLASIDTSFVALFAQTTQQSGNGTDVFALKLAPVAAAAGGRMLAAQVRSGTQALDLGTRVSANIERVLRGRQRLSQHGRPPH